MTADPPRKRGPKPKFGKPMVKKTVTLDEMTLRKAAVVAPTLSDAIRLGIDLAYRRYQAQPDT